MTVYVVVGYKLGYSPSSPKMVETTTSEVEAERKAINYCSRNGSGAPRKVSEGYFASEIGKSEYAEARIYKRTVNADATTA